MFGITYALSCVTKVLSAHHRHHSHISILTRWVQHSSDYWVLMVGRLLGGVATSLLFSVFEAAWHDISYMPHRVATRCTRHAPSVHWLPFLALMQTTRSYHLVPLQSWMIASHFKMGFNGDQLGDTFTKAPAPAGSCQGKVPFAHASGLHGPVSERCRCIRPTSATPSLPFWPGWLGALLPRTLASWPHSTCPWCDAQDA